MGLVCDESGAALAPGDKVYGAINADMQSFEILCEAIVAKIPQSLRHEKKNLCTSDKGINIYSGELKTCGLDATTVFCSHYFLFWISWDTARKFFPNLVAKLRQKSQRSRRMIVGC